MALTEKYVSSLAGGGGDGLSAGSPLTFAGMVTAINAGTEAGSRFNVKADGTYSRGASDTVTGVGTATSPIIIRGYLTTIGDGYQGRATFGGSGPLVTTHMPSIVYGAGFNLVLPAASYIVIESLNVSGAMPSAALVGGGAWSIGSLSFSVVSNTVASGTSATAAVFGTSGVTLYGSDLLLIGSGSLSTSSAAAQLTNGTARVIGCHIRSANSRGITGSGSYAAAGNVIYRCGTIGVVAAANHAILDGNTIVACTSDGVLVGGVGNTSAKNNLITDNGGYGINAPSGTPLLRAFNRLDRNTSGASPANDWATATSYGDNATVVTQAQEYVDAANDDYRLLSTSPAKAAGHFPYADIGALQSQGGIFLVEDD